METNLKIDGENLPDDLAKMLDDLGFIIRVVPVEYAVPQSPPTNEEREVMTTQTAKLTGSTTQVADKNVDVVRHGKQIVIPESMTFKDARAWLERKEISEEEVAGVHEIIESFPLDGSYAFMRAMNQIYGWTDMIPTPGFWGDKIPPTMIGLPIDVDKSVQVLWGRAQIPNVSGYLETGFALKDGRIVFRIGGQVKRKNLPEVARIAELTREIASKESVYKGKAIRISFEKITPENFNPEDAQPSFFDTRKVRSEDLIFPDEVQELVDVNLFTPIEKTAECRQHQIPLKRGILLEGPFGVGKTLTADVTAKKAVDNGWTFIYLKDVKQLNQAILFAQQYQPAVIFAEDIDSVLDSDEDRSEQVNAILNTIDGVDTKHSEIMVVLTTNHVEDIEQAMIRPGRLDAIIPVRAPDEKAVGRLIRLYGRTLINKDENIEEACALLAGQIPATVREVVERSKLAAIRHNKGEALRLTGADLKVASRGMMAHLELLKPIEIDKRSDMEKAATILGDKLMNGGKLVEGKANGKSSKPDKVIAASVDA